MSEIHDSSPPEEQPQEQPQQQVPQEYEIDEGLLEESFDREPVEDDRQQQQPLLPAEPTTSSLPISLPSFKCCSCSTFLLPLAAFATHALFIYAQTAPMWRLSLQQTELSFWANATDTQSQLAFDTLGLHHEQHYYHEAHERNVKEFTYGYAIQELWRAKGLPGTFLPRLTAVLLLLCSGLWPHLKLLLLNITFLMPCSNFSRQKRVLHWLSVLGKWSLADVLTVCVMVAVLHLEWNIDANVIHEGIMNNLPLILNMVQELYSTNELCSAFLKYDCTSPHKATHIASCQACKSFVHTAYLNKKWAESTGRDIMRGIGMSANAEAQIELSVKGMRGIYAFCGAVVLSIGLSLVVDVILDRRRQENVAATEEQPSLSSAVQDVLRRHEALEQQRITSFQLATPSMMMDDDDSDAEPTLFVYPSIAAAEEQHRRRQQGYVKWFLTSIRQLLLPIATITIVLCGTLLPTMKREAKGAFPMILHEVLGITWEKPYSFQTLMLTTGAAGGWDWMLMGTFALFIVIGPIVRALLVVLTAILPAGTKRQCMVASAVDFVGAFCAWEVLVIAVVMTDMLMPTITNTIHNSPKCGVLVPEEGGSCFKVKFDVLSTMGLVAAGGSLLLVTSALVLNHCRWRGDNYNEVSPSDYRPLLDQQNEVAFHSSSGDIDDSATPRVHNLG